VLPARLLGIGRQGQRQTDGGSRQSGNE